MKVKKVDSPIKKEEISNKKDIIKPGFLGIYNDLRFIFLKIFEFKGKGFHQYYEVFNNHLLKKIDRIFNFDKMNSIILTSIKKLSTYILLHHYPESEPDSIIIEKKIAISKMYDKFIDFLSIKKIN